MDDKTTLLCVMSHLLYSILVIILVIFSYNGGQWYSEKGTYAPLVCLMTLGFLAITNLGWSIVYTVLKEDK